MNFQKENVPSNSQDVKEILAKILKEYKVDSLKYLKNKKIFKGEYLIFLKQSQKILLFLQSTNENSLHIIELNEEMVLKSTKINLNFVKKGGKIEFEVKKIVVSSDEKLISFVGKQHLAIIEMRAIMNNKDNKKEIEVIHSTVEKDKFLCFQFANFENYYATMDSCFFRLYEYGNSPSFCDINLIDYKPKMKSFCFGPKHDFGWQIFAIFFINSEGKIFIVCPIFPLSFHMTFRHLDNLNEFQSSLDYFDVTNKDKKLQNILNNNLLNRMKISMDRKDAQNKIVSDKYLREMNNDPCLTQLIILDKRDQSSFIGDTTEIMSVFQYSDITVLSCFPLCIIRKSNLGLIDIIVLNDIINPIRNEEISSSNINAYLLETIFLPTRETLVIEKNLNFLKKLGVKTRVITSSFSLNHCIYVNYLNDLLKIDLSYINNLSSFYKRKTAYDLEFYMKSKVSKVYKYNYSTIFDKISKRQFNEILGFYGIILSFELKAIIYSNENELDIEEIDEGKKQSQMFAEWQKINVLARQAQLQPIDYKSLYENLKNAFQINVLMPDILGKKLVIDEQALKYMESGETKRAGVHIYNKIQEIVIFYENIFNKNYEYFKIKIKNLLHILNESKSIFNLLDPSLQSISKNVKEISEMDRITKEKKNVIERKLEKINWFIKQIYNCEPLLLQKRMKIHEMLHGNKKKLYNLHIKLKEISEEYQRIVDKQWNFNVPFDGMKSSLKQRITSLNKIIQHISQSNRENLDVLLYLKNDS